MRGRIIGERAQLEFELPQHDPLDGHGDRRDRCAATDPREDSQHEPAETALGVTAATARAAAGELRGEDRAMALLVRAKFLEVPSQRRVAPEAHQALAAIDANGAVLSCVIHLQHAVGVRELRGSSWRASPSTIPQGRGGRGSPRNPGHTVIADSVSGKINAPARCAYCRRTASERMTVVPLAPAVPSSVSSPLLRVTR
jgi:hypothetical protein